MSWKYSRTKRKVIDIFCEVSVLWNCFTNISFIEISSVYKPCKNVIKSWRYECPRRYVHKYETESNLEHQLLWEIYYQNISVLNTKIWIGSYFHSVDFFVHAGLYDSCSSQIMELWFLRVVRYISTRRRNNDSVNLASVSCPPGPLIDQVYLGSARDILRETL